MNLQRRKNYLVLILLLLFAALVFGVTIVKVTEHGPNAVPAVAEQKSHE